MYSNHISQQYPLVNGKHSPADIAHQQPSAHWLRQMTDAHQSRQRASPHHHARQAAALARTSTLSLLPANNLKERPNHSEKPQATWTELDMGGMGLQQLAQSLAHHYTFLTKLYVNHNNLTSLPRSLMNLQHLQVLDASSNQLATVPEELGLLVNLRELLLFDNCLVTLPTELGTLYQLETLGLEGNPIDPSLRQILADEGSAAVIMSLRENAEVGMPPPQREWVTVSPDEDDADEEKFTVLSYNVLCQKYATSQAYGYTPCWALAWDYRKELLMTEILNYNAEIICLQEIEMAQFEEFFRDRLEEAAGYQSLFFPKSRAKTMADNERRAVDGCAIFYKSDKFELISHHLLEYNQSALQRADLKASDDTYNRVMPKDNVAVIILLRNKANDTELLVANSHTHWDPQFADVKLVQVGMMMDELARIQKKHPQQQRKRAVIVCGDYNSEPDSSVYELLAQGTVKPDHVDFGGHQYGDYTRHGISHPFKLKSAYPSELLPFTNYTPGFKGVLDYIWYSTETLEVASLLGPIDRSYLSRVVGLPNPHFPSDHIPLMAELKFNKKAH